MRAVIAKVCFGVSCSIFATAAVGETVLSGELMLWCSEAGRAACGPYIMGVAEAPASEGKFCTREAKRIQIIEAVVGQMKIQPPSDLAPAGLSVARALEHAFPCPK
jgi:Rap1a immunity proteins